MLKIKNVSAVADTTEILNNINLTINAGEVHAVLGPSGSGKSALAHLIQGNPFLTQTEGDLVFKNKNINKVPTHKRTHLGIFTTFQMPPEIEGLTNRDLTRAIIELNNESEVAYKNLVKLVGLDSRFTEDPVNTCNRSLSDNKKSELLQALMIQPDLLILDEIDVDLDPDALDMVILLIQEFLLDKSKALMIITSNKRILDSLKPDYVHIMVGGEIKEHGTTELYTRILEDGNPQFS